MNNAISGVDNVFRFSQGEIRPEVQNSIYGLSHYFDFSLDGAARAKIAYKIVKPFRAILKIAFDLLDSL